MSSQLPASTDLAEMLDHWVENGIITGVQADRIRADAQASTAAPGTASTPRGASVVTEAMGYLGGVIVLVGLGLVTGMYWDQLSTATRVALALSVAALLSVAGAAAPPGRGGVAVRLRSVLWLAASAALFCGLVLLALDGLHWDPAQSLVLAGGGTVLASAGMWGVHRHVLQHATVLAALLVTAGAAGAMLTDSDPVPAMVVWAIGGLWCVLAILHVVQPRRTGLVLGSIAAIIASMTVEGEAWGSAVALITVVTLVAVAVAIRDLVVLAVASVGTLAALPPIIVRYFPGLLSAALTLITVGLLLVGVAVYTARKRREPRAPGTFGTARP